MQQFLRYSSRIFILVIFVSCASQTKKKVWVKEAGLWVDIYEVSIAEFSTFKEATSYITTADSLGWSGYFSAKSKGWEVDSNLNWKLPFPEFQMDSTLPVTQVSYDDACDYCAWKKGRLPSAKEWDALAGKEQKVGNIWQGAFPAYDVGTDGYVIQTAPVGSFAANEYGIHDLFGNVWEWTSTDGVHPYSKEKGYVIKGGSYLCQRDVCRGYIPAYYQVTPRNSGTNHLGFRCVYEIE